MAEKKLLQRITVFISSPGDVSKERQIAIRVIERLNKIAPFAQRYILTPLAYEEVVPASIGRGPQTIVDHYMQEAGKADLFICILWSRMGTLVIDEATGEEYQSGTEYEFINAYRAYQRLKSPHMLLYCCTRRLPPTVDVEQLARVQAFFKRFKGPNADFKGLFKSYRTEKQFENMLFQDLNTILAKDLLKIDESTSERDPAPAQVPVSTEKLKMKLQHQREHILTRFISGSNRIKVGNLLNSPRLFISFRWQLLDRQNPGNLTIFDYLLAPLQAEVATNEQENYLILADPGIGKSTLTYKLFSALLDLWSQNKSRYVPLYIDLREYIGSNEFGSQQWLVAFLDELSGTTDISWEEIHERPGSRLTITPFVILDSLDEYLASFTPSETARELSRLVFRVANVITCRTQYYERYLAMSTFSTYFQKLGLYAWTTGERKAYTQSYYQFCFPHRQEDLTAIVSEKIDRSPQLQELCQVPLRLNMTLELLSNPQIDPAQIEDLLALYHAYIHHWLTREVSRSGNALSLDEKFQILEDISWYFYDEGQMGTNAIAPFTRSELTRILQDNPAWLRNKDVQTVLEDLIGRTILLEQTAHFMESEPTILRFTHKSFHEYFVARYLYHQVTQDAKNTANAFRRIISPEVSEFLKEYIKRINRDPRLLDVIVKQCIAAFQLNDEMVVGKAVSPARMRIAREQLSYYLGNVKSPKVREFLINHLEHETDLWTKRGIIIGLSFGGDDKYLHQYIDRLKKAREEKTDPAENEVNIGFHLSFFGDQVMDELSPDRDQGLPNCENTLKRLIYQLGTETDRGSWRLNLYTVLDIGKYREVSRENFVEVMLNHLRVLAAIVEKLRKDQKCNWWPELDEMAALIQDLAQLESKK